MFEMRGQLCSAILAIADPKPVESAPSSAVKRRVPPQIHIVCNFCNKPIMLPSRGVQITTMRPGSGRTPPAIIPQVL